jgi:hypothetical protein
VLEGEITSTQGQQKSKLMLVAGSERYLRVDRYSDLTGTVLGRIIGITPPAIVCTLPVNAKFLVSELATVGRNRTWIKGTME